VVSIATVLSDFCKGYVMDRTATLVVPARPLIPTFAIKVCIILAIKLEDLDASHLTITARNGSDGLFDFCL
jgi:hypothetical protein